jgi:single-strand DNA-binding protein
MPNLNKVMLMGNLTRDPEIKYTPKGMAIASFGIAVNRVWSNEGGEKQEEVTFIDIEMFGRKAEVVGEYFTKGKPIYVEGRLKLDSWDDKNTGQKKSKLKVIGETFEFLGGKDGGEQQERRPAQQRSERQAPPAAKRPPTDQNRDAAEELDVPF